MRKIQHLGNGLRLGPAELRRLSGQSLELLRSDLARKSDIERVRRAMIGQGLGPIEQISDQAIYDEVTRQIGIGRLGLLTGQQGRIIPDDSGRKAPKPLPLPKIDPSELENPYKNMLGNRLNVKAWGMIISGSHFASQHFDSVVAGHSAEVDPTKDPEQERIRLLREQRERVAARLQGEALTREYQRDVKSVLTMIRSSATGLALITEIQRQAAVADILIEPYPFEKRSAGANDRPPPQGVRQRKFGPQYAVVYFTPEQWRRKYLLYSLIIEGRWGKDDEWGPGTQPDEVLLHELVHAFFTTTGKELTRRVPFQGQRYKTRSRNKNHPRWRGPYEMDDFMAVLIANIYRSELGRDKIRHSHTNFKPYDMTDEQFLKIGMNRAHIRLLRRKQPRLFNALNDVDAPWNPTRAFRDSPRGDA